MTLEVGTSVQKLIAMTIVGMAGLLLLANGHYEAGIALLGPLMGFAIGEANGKKLKAKETQDRKELDYL